MAMPSGSFFKVQTPLQQLLEDINLQRTREIRQLFKDDCGFVMLQGTTYWTDLFVRHFIFQTETAQSIDSDDLLFFVRKKHVKGSSRHMPKYEQVVQTEVDVFRKDSRKLPISDPDVDWEETVYLNMIIHQFDYILTLAICTRTSPKQLQVLRRHSQRVYASPSRRKMDTKGDGEEMTYPHIGFMVDNFDEVFSDILVRDGEMVCVELVANDKDGTVQGVIFLGSIRYDALKKVYDARQSSLSSKVAQRMSFGLFSSGAGVQTRCEFVRMKGPQGKGHAEMAVTKPKGSGVETPTSEPGFCATDRWEDSDDERSDFYGFRHQRRLSDPSVNLNNFMRYGWNMRRNNQTAGAGGGKARSQNEGLDSIANDISEIEACDLRDDLRPAFSASEAKLNTLASCKVSESDNHQVDVTSPTETTSGCNCFCRGSRCKRWSDTDSAQMSEIHCGSCDEEATTNSTPACLNKIPDKKTKPKHKTILSVESELIYSSCPKDKSRSKKDKVHLSPKKQKSKKNAKLERAEKAKSCHGSINGSNNNIKAPQEYEIADDATSLNGEMSGDALTPIKIAVLSEADTKLMISVRGREELPVEQPQKAYSLEHCVLGPTDSHPLQKSLGTQDSGDLSQSSLSVSESQCNSAKSKSQKSSQCNDKENPTEQTPMLINYPNDWNGNKDGLIKNSGEIFSMLTTKENNLTFPRWTKKTNSISKLIKVVPKRTTPDGTDIYYWCDLPKKALKELEEGSYNPFWPSRGFSQAFQFWRDSNRRQQSVPLNAFLTYVTLPWWSIAKDVLDHREPPILTF